MAANQLASSSVDPQAVAPDACLNPAVTFTSTSSCEESLLQKGESMLKRIEEIPTAFVYVEASRSARAKCRAGQDCLHIEDGREETTNIKDQYRICVYGTELLRYGDGLRSTYYYHVSCFGSMI
jgi:hypothetical protein